jgi:hypothetical protein
MTLHLDTISESLRKSLNAKIQEAITTFDPEIVFKRMQSQLLNNANEVADKMLGLDRRWSSLDIDSKGLLYKHLEPRIKGLVTEYLEPRIANATASLLATKQIQNLIDRAIKRKVVETVENLGGYKNHLEGTIETMVEEEIEKTISAWAASQPDNSWVINK